MRRMAMGVGALESTDLGAPSKYLKHILLVSRIFQSPLKSKNPLKNEKISNQISKFRDEFLKNP